VPQEHLLSDAVLADVLLGDAHGATVQFLGQKGTQGRPGLQRKQARFELGDEAIRVSKHALKKKKACGESQGAKISVDQIRSTST